MRASDGLQIELHWRCAPAFFGCPLGFDVVVDRLVSMDVLGTAVRTMSRMDTVLTTALHGAKHGWQTLGAVADLAALAAQVPCGDWENIFAESRRLRIARTLTTGLALADRMVGAALPPLVMDRVRSDRQAKAIGDAVARELVREKPRKGPMRTTLLHLRLGDRLADRLRHVVRLTLMPTPEDWTFCGARDEASLWPYAVRPVRLAVKYAWSPRQASSARQGCE
jgi:hypothetical protein